MNETDEAPSEEKADARKKYMTRRDCALAIIVLAHGPIVTLFAERIRGSMSYLENV